MLTASEASPADDRHLIDALVSKHTSLVKRIAYKLIANLPPSIDLQDLIQIGMIGLLEAAERFRDRGDSSFATYATYRVRGAMIDALRHYQWTPRAVTRELRRIGLINAEIESPTGTESTAKRMAKALDIPVSTYHRTLWDASQGTMVSLHAQGSTGEEFWQPDLVDQSPGPDESLEREQSLSLLAAAIDELTESERTILLLYYDEEMLLREIGDTLDLTESRICQIQKKTLSKLRNLMLRHPEFRHATISPAAPRTRANIAPARPPNPENPANRANPARHWRHRALPEQPSIFADARRERHTGRPDRHENTVLASGDAE